MYPISRDKITHTGITKIQIIAFNDRILLEHDVISHDYIFDSELLIKKLEAISLNLKYILSETRIVNNINTAIFTVLPLDLNKRFHLANIEAIKSVITGVPYIPRIQPIREMVLFLKDISCRSIKSEDLADALRRSQDYKSGEFLSSVLKK